MRELISKPTSRPVLNAALATLGLTAVHHIYGGLVYHTPWRLHGAGLAVLAGAVLVGLSTAYTRAERARRRRIAGYSLAVLVLAIPVLAIGAFEGFYNHVIKNFLFVTGAPHDLLVRLFPPPTYELPDDAWFELSGIAQVLPATVAALAIVRFVRGLRQPSRGCLRPACNEIVRLRGLVAVTDESLELPDPDRLVHLQFRRFAGCPICNLHLRSFVRRHAEIGAAGVREIVVFHSPAKELRVHAGELPFAVIADPDRRLYREFGVESSRRALLDPRVWGTIMVAVLRGAIAILRRREHAPALVPHGGRFGLPADFLIASDGRILACKHGAHADDQWSVDEMLERAAQVNEEQRQRRSEVGRWLESQPHHGSAAG
jgi:hypothetical protein